ncbi:MAG: ATP-grasp domain-containing protein [Candidatus Promineifilaceae bacterium]
MSQPLTFVCIASGFKGESFMSTLKQLGCRVFLVTEEKLKDEAWPREALDDVFLMPDLSRHEDVLFGVSFLARTNTIDRVIGLDDYDVRLAANLREHMRIPGMGDTTGRYFRDKLAMRKKAEEAGIPVPAFIHILNYDRLNEYMATVAPPWVFKPRFEAGSVGIKKANSPEEVWAWINELGDQQSFYLLEQFVPGDVYHVDAIVSEKEIVFATAHKYGRPPMSVSHEGGVFMTRTLPHDGEEATALKALNGRLMGELGMVRGVTHTEYIRSHADGRFYFLETAARVGGAHIAETVEAATGVNLWSEWAKIEVAQARKETYHLPEVRHDYAGILVCLARQEWPDMSGYQEPEIVWRINKKQHAGLIVASPDPARIESLLDEYGRRFAEDFLAIGHVKEAKRTA